MHVGLPSPATDALHTAKSPGCALVDLVCCGQNRGHLDRRCVSHLHLGVEKTIRMRFASARVHSDRSINSPSVDPRGHVDGVGFVGSWRNVVQQRPALVVLCQKASPLVVGKHVCTLYGAISTHIDTHEHMQSLTCAHILHVDLRVLYTHS